MRKYLINGVVTVSCWTFVEAESEDEAIEIASNREVARIHIDGTYENTEFFHIDVDGSPQRLIAEQAD